MFFVCFAVCLPSWAVLSARTKRYLVCLARGCILALTRCLARRTGMQDRLSEAC